MLYKTNFIFWSTKDNVNWNDKYFLIFLTYDNWNDKYLLIFIFMWISDRIFDDHMTTYDLFQEIAKPIIDAAVQGFHGDKIS